MRVHWIVAVLSLVFLALSTTTPGLAADAIYYVSPAGDDANDGERPEDAFATIGKAIQAANPTGSDRATVRIAAGRYRENLELKSGIVLEGGWNQGFSEQWNFATDGYEPDVAYEVIIDGGGLAVQQPCIKVENLQALTVSGVTLTNGRGVQAGAISIDNATLLLENARFTDNIARGKYGGNTGGWYAFGDALYVNNADFSMQNCGFSDHPAEVGGNTVYIAASTVSIQNCDFSNVYGEPAVVDGSYSVICNLDVTATLQACTFENNAAFKEGYRVTAIQNFGTSMVTIATCTFEGNDVAVANYGATVTIRDSLFADNGGSAPFAAAIWNSGSDPLITNCLFSGNLGPAADVTAGGAMVNDAASPQVTNCTFYNNTHPTGTANLAVTNINGSMPTFTNAIFWCDSCATVGEPFYTDASSAVTVTYSDVQGGFVGDGNIDRDPRFDASAVPALQLSPGSPCIDAGDNTVVQAPAFGDPALDYEGYPRRYDDPSTQDTGRGQTPFVDLGAYEFESSSQFGSLTVTILSPAPNGARWRVDGGAWKASGETQTGLTPGNHTVSYKTVAGWDKPASIPVTITAEQEQTIEGRYVQQTGSLTVTLEPAEAVAAGAQWRVGDGTWRNSGDTQSGIPAGTRTISFKAVDGWSLPQDDTVTILDEQTVTATATYTRQKGDLQVTLQLPFPDGAGWRVDEGDWKASGETQSGLRAGSHIVSYKPVPGWTPPQDDTVTIEDQTLTTLTSGLYIQQTGSLRVTIEPAAAATAGARWRVDGGDWRGTGFIEPGLTVGDHLVEFEAVADWAKTGSQLVSITDGQTTETVGAYTKASGSLTVTLEPAAAVAAGAMWRVDGGAWRGSGSTETGLAVGAHLVEYNTVSGWSAPSPSYQTVVVAAGETATASAAYVQQTGSLTVTLAPQEAVSAGAQWRLDGGAWQNSGQTLSDVGAGSHSVDFKAVAGWTAPESQTLVIQKDETTSASGTYQIAPGDGGGGGGGVSGGGCFLQTLASP